MASLNTVFDPVLGDGLMTAAEVAGLFRVTAETVLRSRVTANRPPEPGRLVLHAVEIPGGRLRFLRSQVAAVLDPCPGNVGLWLQAARERGLDPGI
jgi:hypothetical protein